MRTSPGYERAQRRLQAQGRLDQEEFTHLQSALGVYLALDVEDDLLKTGGDMKALGSVIRMAYESGATRPGAIVIGYLLDVVSSKLRPRLADGGSGIASGFYED